MRAERACPRPLPTTPRPFCSLKYPRLADGLAVTPPIRARRTAPVRRARDQQRRRRVGGLEPRPLVLGLSHDETAAKLSLLIHSPRPTSSLFGPMEARRGANRSLARPPTPRPTAGKWSCIDCTRHPLRPTQMYCPVIRILKPKAQPAIVRRHRCTILGRLRRGGGCRALAGAPHRRDL